MLRIATPDLGIGPHDQRLTSGAPTESLRATRRAEMEPSGASAPAQPAPADPERDQRTRELFFEKHGAAVRDQHIRIAKRGGTDNVWVKWFQGHQPYDRCEGFPYSRFRPVQTAAHEPPV